MHVGSDYRILGSLGLSYLCIRIYEIQEGYWSLATEILALFVIAGIIYLVSDQYNNREQKAVTETPSDNPTVSVDDVFDGATLSFSINGGRSYK